MKCEACNINDAVYNVRIINKILCYDCLVGNSVNGRVYQSTDYSKLVTQ